MLLQDIVFDYNHDLQNYRRRFIHAWGMVKKTDTKTLGHRNSIPWEPYLKWVRARAQNLMMPFTLVLPVIMEPVALGDIPIDFEDLKRSWIQLKEERDTFEAQYYESEKKVLELTKLLHEERHINSYLGTKRKRPWDT